MDFLREKSAAKKINQLYLEAVTLLKKNLVIFGSASTFSRAHKLNGPQGKKEVLCLAKVRHRALFPHYLGTEIKIRKFIR